MLDILTTIDFTQRQLEKARMVSQKVISADERLTAKEGRSVLR